MQYIDWLVLSLFFLVMVLIGFWSFKKVTKTTDFYIAGGQLPWWLSGISHHVSGYSGAVFVAYAAIAYTHGISLYFWWALTIAISIFCGSKIFPPAWVRLRIHYQVESPTEYLEKRYNALTQQIMAWSGVVLKLFDVAAKWSAIALLLNVFTEIPLLWGILLSGGISLVYITVGGIWADVWTDFAQFIVQIIAGIVMFVVVLNQLGNDSVWTIWEQLPEKNHFIFTEPYTIGFALSFLIINFLSYNGGTWNLATRYISSKDGNKATKAAKLSGILYLFWPLILFFPMWAAPILLPNLDAPNTSYALLTQELLPTGLVGLVLASMFANTMSMTSSDVNTISAVITRDIFPKILPHNFIEKNNSLKVARIVTFVFTAITILMATQADSFGGVFGLIISWFGALVGPIAVPMLLGLLYPLRRSGPISTISSIVGGLFTFVATKYFLDVSMVVEIVSPVLVSLFLFISLGLVIKDGLHSNLPEHFYKSLKAD